MTSFCRGYFGDGAADFVALESEVVELVFDGAQRCADSRRSGADDREVVDSWDGRSGPLALSRAAIVSTQSRP